VQVEDYAQAGCPAPFQALVYESKAAFFIHTGLGILLQHRVINRQAHVIHAPGGNLSDIAAPDKGFEMGLPRRLIQVGRVLGEPAAQVNARLVRLPAGGLVAGLGSWRIGCVLGCHGCVPDSTITRACISLCPAGGCLFRAGKPAA
jgi:hypothetical protein